MGGKKKKSNPTNQGQLFFFLACEVVMEQWDLLHLELKITLIRKNKWNFTKVGSLVLYASRKTCLQNQASYVYNVYVM